jgi:diacylglycerol kinase family enzyme
MRGVQLAGDVISPHTRRVLILVNPKAGRQSAGQRVDRLIQLLQDRGLVTDVLTDPAAACALANRFHSEGNLRALVGVGGDGTAAELVNRTQPGVPLTLLASGTANLLSNHFGLSGDPAQLCRVITAGRLFRMDAGQASGRLFVALVGCGFDADVVRRVHAYRHADPSRGGHISYASYLKPIFQAIRSYEYPEIKVYCDEQDAAEEPSVVARWAFVLNLPSYGWGLALAPAACESDGLLNLCTLKHGSLWHGLRYLVAAQVGARHQRLSDCDTRRVRRLRLTSEGSIPYQLDGDPGGYLPVEIEVLPGRCTWVVPAADRAGAETSSSTWWRALKGLSGAPGKGVSCVKAHCGGRPRPCKACNLARSF